MPGVAPDALSTSSPTCHVVVLSTDTSLDTRTTALMASCATLDTGDRLAIRDAAALWRDWKPARQRLQALCRERGWPGLVLVYAIKRKFTPPPPLDMPIEPLEVSESNPAIRAIAERAGAAETTTETSAAIRAWRRALARGGTGFIGFVSPLINAIVGLAMRNWTQFYINAGIMALGIVIFGVVWWVTSAQWFIVPGGLIRRRGVVGKVGVQLTRFRPADTLLVARPFPPAGWQVSLVTGEHEAALRLTPLELSVLLALWQSALPCPAIEQLDDLRQAGARRERDRAP